jgi:hypothetical protein
MRRVVLLVAFVAALALAGTAAAVAQFVNGSFETGDFTGWTHVDQGGGSWFVYSGTTTPVNGFSFFAPPDGTYAAVTDQFGPGGHVLYQDIAVRNVPATCQDRIKFTLYYNNRAGVFFNPATLDYTVVPNQQYRVDIMRPGSPDFSVAPGDVLANVFQTTALSPTVLAPTTFSVSTAPWAGQTVRIRFAEVDNQFFFNAAVDNVQYVPQKLCKVYP